MVETNFSVKLRPKLSNKSSVHSISNHGWTTFMSLIILHTGWPKIRYTIFLLFCIWSLNSISPKYLMPINALIIENEVHFNKVRFWKWHSERIFSDYVVIWQTSRFEISFKIFQFTCFLIFKRCQSFFVLFENYIR